MTNPTSSRIAAACLVVGAALFSIGDLLRRIVEPSGSFSHQDLVRAVVRQPGLWGLAAVLAVVATICFLPGLVGLTLTAHGRGAGTTLTGAALLGVGMVASVGHAIGYFGPFGRFADSGASAGNVDDFLDAGGDPATVLCIVLFMVGVILGPIVLAVGLRRARRIPVWAVVAAVVFVACGSTSGVPVGAIGLVAALLTFVPAARGLWIAGGTAAPLEPRPTAVAG